MTRRLLGVMGIAAAATAIAAALGLPGAPVGAGTRPDQFSFTETCGNAPGVVVESGSVTVTGITEPVPISVSNGEYSINGGPYTSEDATVSFGQTVSVRHTTAPTEDAIVNTELFIGGTTATFSSSTGPCQRGTN